jgi:hypothetical protein
MTDLEDMTEEEYMQYVLQKYGNNPTWVIPSPLERQPGEVLLPYNATLTLRIRGGTIGENKEIELKFLDIELKDIGSLVASVIREEPEEILWDPALEAFQGPSYLNLGITKARLVEDETGLMYTMTVIEEKHD